LPWRRYSKKKKGKMKKRKIIKLMVLGVLSVILLLSIFALTKSIQVHFDFQDYLDEETESCSYLQVSNSVYTLSSDIYKNTRGACIKIKNQKNITLDCNSHKIVLNNDSVGGSNGISVSDSENIRIKNCILISNNSASNKIYFENVTYSQIVNCTVLHDGLYEGSHIYHAGLIHLSNNSHTQVIDSTIIQHTPGTNWNNGDCYLFHFHGTNLGGSENNSLEGCRAFSYSNCQYPFGVHIENEENDKIINSVFIIRNVTHPSGYPSAIIPDRSYKGKTVLFIYNTTAIYTDSKAKKRAVINAGETEIFYAENLYIFTDVESVKALEIGGKIERNVTIINSIINASEGIDIYFNGGKTNLNLSNVTYKELYGLT
jgi:hypothetical protein